MDMQRIGPHSRPHKLQVIDGRSAEARRMKAIRAELVEHVGGNPSTAQRLLIDRVAMLLLRMELMDREALAGSPMTDIDQRAYLGWNNAVSRALRHLGLDSKEQPKRKTLADHLRERAA